MWFVIIVLFVVIGVLGWYLVVTPAPFGTGTATTTGTGNGTDIGGGTNTGTSLASRVVIDAPKSGATVPKTFTVTGKAPGNWFFEASFPIQVRDANNKVIGQGIAQALSDWMTTGDVPFKAEISTASSTYTGAATLVLMRDNPSGLPENDDAVSIPITIQQ